MENAPQDDDSNDDDADNECEITDNCAYDPTCDFYYDSPRLRGCRHYEPNRILSSGKP